MTREKIGEEWRDAIGYEGLYRVSNLGRVKSLNYKLTGREGLLKPGDNKGYLSVVLFKNNKPKGFLVHRIVAFAFIKNPMNKKFINHIDGSKTNNNVSNLEWCTASENMKHNFLVLGYTPVIKGCKKVSQYTLEGIFIKTWDSIVDVERKLFINRSSISACCRGRYKTAGGYIWKYKI